MCIFFHVRPDENGFTPFLISTNFMWLDFSCWLIRLNCNVNAATDFRDQHMDVLMMIHACLIKAPVVLMQKFIRGVIKAGCDARKAIIGWKSEDRWKKFEADEDYSDDFDGWLQDYLVSPLRLRDITRICIRGLVRQPFLESVEKLELPVRLRQFITFTRQSQSDSQ